MADKEYNIQELVHRDVYVNDKKVGTIVGERHHPNEARVQSMRIQVESDVADEYMRNLQNSHRYQRNWCTASKQMEL